MIYIAVFAGDPSYIWCVVFCCIISPGVPVMSGMQDICSSDSTSVPQGVGRLDNCSVHSRTPLERVNITPHHTTPQKISRETFMETKQNIECYQFFGYKIIRF